MCLRQAQAPRVVVNIKRCLSGVEITGKRNKNVPSTGSGTESSSKYKAVIEGGEIAEMMSENVPSTGSGTGSSSKYNTVIELVEITR